MSDISFLAIPNIEGMRLARYIKIFGIVLLFGVCLFFILYFWFTYRKGKKLVQKLDSFDQRAKDMEKTLALEKIHKSTGKELARLFVDYLERFVTNKSYANLTELLELQWFTAKEAQELAEVLYTDKKISKHLEDKIKTMI